MEQTVLEAAREREQWALEERDRLTHGVRHNPALEEYARNAWDTWRAARDYRRWLETGLPYDQWKAREDAAYREQREREVNP